MKRSLSIVMLALMVLCLSACTTMQFNGDASSALSLEMSNVNGVEGQSFENDEFDTRGFFLVLGLIPIHQEELGDAIGKNDNVANLEITSEMAGPDIGIKIGTSLFSLGWLLDTRGYEVEGDKIAAEAVTAE